MSAISQQQKPLPSYENPPLIEVVCGLVFKRLQGMKIPHFGMIWDKFKSSYPICQHAAPLDVRDESLDPATGAPLPRVWLIGKGEMDLIQLQTDRILYNWRKIRPDDSYPRYSNVCGNFRQVVEKFADGVADLGIGALEPLECELTYINHIPKGEGWNSVEEAQKLFPDLGWRAGSGRFLPSPTSTAWNAAFSYGNLGNLTANLNHATRRVDNFPIFALQLTAKGIGHERSIPAIWAWFDIAHEWIVRGFADLTSESVQREIWKRE